MKERHKSIVAVYLILRKEDEVLLLKRQNTERFNDQFGLPAGHVDPDESILAAMVREAKEEIDLTVKPEALRMVPMVDRNAVDGHRIDVYFECTDWQGEPVNVEPEKCSELRWVTRGDWPEELIHLVRMALEKIDEGQNYSQENWT